jgi:hypothetical protein
MSNNTIQQYYYTAKTIKFLTESTKAKAPKEHVCSNINLGIRQKKID